MKKSSLIAVLALVLLSLLVGCEATEYAAVIATSNGKFHHCYGKVIDQYGQPVVGAQAIATSVFMVSPVASRNEDHFTKTDAQGLFQFTGILGWEVGFGVKKEGYEWSGHGELPDEEKSTPENRDVFIMYKLQGAEPMMHLPSVQAKLPCDGTPMNFDLLSGKTDSTSHDLAVSFVRNPAYMERTRRSGPFDWTLTLQIPNGGLIESSGPYSYEAPESGYEPKTTIDVKGELPWSQQITIDGNTHTEGWDNTFEHLYYFKAENGQIFGRIKIRLTTDYPGSTTHFEFELYANPSGSRNLEWDPAKEIKPEAGGR